MTFDRWLLVASLILVVTMVTVSVYLIVFLGANISNAFQGSAGGNDGKNGFDIDGYKKLSDKVSSLPKLE